MTTYSYKVTLDDGEMIAVQQALSHYKLICEDALKDGPKAPYWAHLRATNGVILRLYDDVSMTSSSGEDGLVVNLSGSDTKPAP